MLKFIIGMFVGWCTGFLFGGVLAKSSECSRQEEREYARYWQEDEND